MLAGVRPRLISLCVYTLVPQFKPPGKRILPPALQPRQRQGTSGEAPVRFSTPFSTDC